MGESAAIGSGWGRKAREQIEAAMEGFDLDTDKIEVAVMSRQRPRTPAAGGVPGAGGSYTEGIETVRRLAPWTGQVTARF